MFTEHYCFQDPQEHSQWLYLLSLSSMAGNLPYTLTPCVFPASYYSACQAHTESGPDLVDFTIQTVKACINLALLVLAHAYHHADKMLQAVKGAMASLFWPSAKQASSQEMVDFATTKLPANA